MSTADEVFHFWVGVQTVNFEGIHTRTCGKVYHIIIDYYSIININRHGFSLKEKKTLLEKFYKRFRLHVTYTFTRFVEIRIKSRPLSEPLTLEEVTLFLIFYVGVSFQIWMC